MITENRLRKYTDLSNPYKDYLTVNPLQTAGILPESVHKALFEEKFAQVGYSICYNCLEGRSSFITKPPIKEFLDNIAEFFGGDEAEHTLGCRAAQFAAMRTISDFVKSERSGEHAHIVLADPNCHYTTGIAAEMNDLELVETRHSGYPEYSVTAEDYASKIEEIKSSRGKLPALIVLTHVEPYYGNAQPAAEIGKIAEEYSIPYMVNCAYSGGVMPVNLRSMKADFLTLSAHKSMASMAPLGYLVTSYDWSKKVFAQSSIRGNWTGRVFGKKLPNLFGCSVGGTPLISGILSFPFVVKRVSRWEEELNKTRWFIDKMEEIEGTMLLGQRPHQHHLLHFETPLLYELSLKHKKKGFFLISELKKRKITGIHAGMTKHIKISVYGYPKDTIEKIYSTFAEIAKA